MHSILIICTANRFRSPIAAIYLAREVVKHGDDNRISVFSAGTWTVRGQPVTPEALSLAKQYDLNVTLHKSRPITQEMLSQADLILVMENNHKEAILQEFPFCADNLYLLTEVVTGIPQDIADPYVTQEAPDVIINEIITLINQGYDRIIQKALTDTSDK